MIISKRCWNSSGSIRNSVPVRSSTKKAPGIFKSGESSPASLEPWLAFKGRLERPDFFVPGRQRRESEAWWTVAGFFAYACVMGGGGHPWDFTYWERGWGNFIEVTSLSGHLPWLMDKMSTLRLRLYEYPLLWQKEWRVAAFMPCAACVASHEPLVGHYVIQNAGLDAPFLGWWA